MWGQNLSRIRASRQLLCTQTPPSKPIWRPETARACPEVSNKIAHAIKLEFALFIPSAGCKRARCWCWMCRGAAAAFCQPGVVNSGPIAQTPAPMKQAPFTLLGCVKTPFFSLPFALTCSSSSPPPPPLFSFSTDFKQPVAEPATSFNSGIARSPEHHLIILPIIPATPTVPPLLHNGIRPE